VLIFFIIILIKFCILNKYEMNQNLTIVSESFLETINEKQDKIISLLQDGKLGSQNDFITEIPIT
jgi:hypothetical protein